MRVLFKGQVPKDPAYPEFNEDAIELATELGRIALSDGASESFDSRTWAKLLVEKFVRVPALSQDWLSDTVSDYFACFNVANLSWSKQAAFERGSFATLLGVESFPDISTIDVLSVGDSLAVLLDGNECVDSYPYTRPEDFKQKPELFCTKTSHNAFFSNPHFFLQHLKTWRLQERNKPILLCMTDALGEWALRNAIEGTPQWQVLSSITELSRLESIVTSEREEKRMRVDDVTLIVMAFDGVNNNGLPHS